MLTLAIDTATKVCTIALCLSLIHICCKADWYYVMNMLHSDFAEILGSDTNNYVRMAKAYINDPDASEGKVLDAWLAQMEA